MILDFSRGRKRGAVSYEDILFGLTSRILHLLKLLLASGGFSDLEHVEPHGLGERSALANGHGVAESDISEAGRKVHRHVAVTTLKPARNQRYSDKRK